MKKTRIARSKEKNALVDRFLAVMEEKDTFLLVGHANPDEDCIASMVAFALLLAKLNKTPTIALLKEHWDQYPYLMSICKYNALNVVGSDEDFDSEYDVIVALDTPKPEMLDFQNTVVPLVSQNHTLVLEMDHHIGADSRYIGDKNYQFVDEASSTCELIGYLAVRMSRKRNLMRRYGITEMFSRNLVLSIVTGMAGDSKMGQFLKSRREKRYYRYFSRLFNKMLIQKTDKNSKNFKSIEEILSELERLTGEEEACYRRFMDASKELGRIAYTALDEETMQELFDSYGKETVVNVAKYVANILAEQSGYLSFVAYYDDHSQSDLIQMRMRRSQGFKNMDLRKVIQRLGIENGGGHEGAVGFRVHRHQILDFPAYVQRVVDVAEGMIPNDS
ncbi:MAG: DHH family phosphoesterase [Spirochaetales bacterium]|nr:DHH family phosphoesterase [Spirochaetales bacterium]